MGSVLSRGNICFWKNNTRFKTQASWNWEDFIFFKNEAVETGIKKMFYGEVIFASGQNWIYLSKHMRLQFKHQKISTPSNSEMVEAAMESNYLKDR